MKLDTLLDQYEAFVQALAKVKGLAVIVEPFKRSQAADIIALEKVVGGRVPDDLRRMWTRGVHSVSIAMNDEHDIVGTHVFLDAAASLVQAKFARTLAADEQDETIKRFFTSGIPLHEDEQYCLVDVSKAGNNRVYQMRFDGAPETDVIAASFTDYFEAWFACGCFSYGDADAKVFAQYWKLVDHLIPVRIEHTKNPWLLHMAKWYGKPKFPAA